VRYGKEHKAETRRRILSTAVSAFRARGLEDVSVAELMSRAGLTHGGFYAHFRSKDQAAAEALGFALEETKALIERAATGAPPGKALDAILEAYLSTTHRDHPESGCVLAALGSEIGRQAPEARRALAQGLTSLITAFAAYMPSDQNRTAEDRALAAMAAMVGGVIMARVAPDPATAARILAVCRDFVLERLSDERRQRATQCQGKSPQPHGRKKTSRGLRGSS